MPDLRKLTKWRKFLRSSSRFIRDQPWITTSAIAVAGVVMLYVGLRKEGPGRISPFEFENDHSLASGMSHKVGETNWKDVRLFVNNSTTPTVLIGLSTAMISVFLIEMANILFRQFLKNSAEKRFEEFFGPGSLSRRVRGRIVLQIDDIETMVTSLVGKDSEIGIGFIKALNEPYHPYNPNPETPTPTAERIQNRLFKARNWVNARDAESARILREALRSRGFPTPELQISRHSRSPFEECPKAPYVISMGLAFTDASIALFDQVDPERHYVYLLPCSKNGDAIAISERVRIDRMNFEFTDQHFELDSNSGGKIRFDPVFPNRWAVDEWLSKSDGLLDYGVIIRHVHKDNTKRQVRILVAGFTEDATVAASRFLAERWEDLWEMFVEARHDTSTDFVAILPGLASDQDPWQADSIISIRVANDGR